MPDQFRRLNPVQRWKVDVNDDHRWLQSGHQRESLLTALCFSDDAQVSVRRQQVTKKATYLRMIFDEENIDHDDRFWDSRTYRLQTGG